MRWPWLTICMSRTNCCKLWYVSYPVTACYPVWAGGDPHQLGTALGALLSGSSDWWASSNRGNAGKSWWNAWPQMLRYSFCPNFHWRFTTVKVRIYSGHIGKKKKEKVFPNTKSGVGGISFSFWHEYNKIFLMIVIQTSQKWKVKSNSF